MSANPVQIVPDIGSDRPDLDPSTDRYAARFSGAAGEWLLSVQTRALRDLMPEGTHHLLDVGGGHGQIARPMLEDGHRVTVLASVDDAFGRLPELQSDRLTLKTGSLMDLPFEDQSFDVVTSFRMMAHVGDWERLLREMTRVARHAVIFDFPTPSGANALEPLLFGLKKRIEGDTRRFTVIRASAVRQHLESLGFAPGRSIGQFTLPMVVHRKLARPAISQRMEDGLTAVGLASAIGSPVVMRADRKAI
ncbi:class I SAM-dependent methyltransferase [Aestuariibius insulae]|uniref:class I SAM-dependent methyltransferase n=1 Tax=Aestuariibius insulae TaxID=2058287 RepID=UPI00345ECE42